MCLTLYMATTGDQPLMRSPYLSVEEIEPEYAAVRQWLRLPTVRYIGTHMGCSCAFQSIICDSPFEFYEGMFEYDESNQADLRSTEELLAMVRAYADRDGEVELLPTWSGDEAQPPMGTVERHIDQLEPRTFFFVQQFLYRVSGPSA